jgi:hypothetical protein
MMGVTSRVGVAPTAPQRPSKTRSAPHQRIRRTRLWSPIRSSSMWTQGSSRGSSMMWCRLLKRLPFRIPCLSSCSDTAWMVDAVRCTC